MSKNSKHQRILWITLIVVPVLTLLCISVYAVKTLGFDTVYYTEFTCKPEENVFEMQPKFAKYHWLAVSNHLLWEKLKEKQQFAVLLNGDPVGEKMFRDTCQLKNGVTIKVDVDYGRHMAIQSNKEIIKLFKKTHDFIPSYLIKEQVEVNVRKNGELIASIGSSFTDEKDSSISMLNISHDILKLTFLSNEHNLNKELSISDLITNPFTWIKSGRVIID